MAGKPVPISAENPQLRLDILLLRLAEAGARWAEYRAATVLKVPVSLWDGPGGVGAVLEQKLDELGVPREQLTPATVARIAGFIGRRPKLRKEAA